MAPETIVPDWPVPARVRALVTTRSLGDMRRGGAGRAKLRALLPSEPLWLRQVHGLAVADADRARCADEWPQADAAVARAPGAVCAVSIADCMPVLLAEQRGGVVGIAHAGWRGLAAGVVEATLEAMRAPPANVIAWLGPAIGPRAYEVEQPVPGLYAVARQRLAARGVARVHGGGFCTHSEPQRFFSYRRDRAAERMAALVWIADAGA